MIPLDNILPVRPAAAEYEHLCRWAETDAHPYAESTFWVWRRHLAIFQAYCESQGRNWLPADSTTILDFLHDHQYHWKPRTLVMTMSVIKCFHQRARVRSGFDDDNVKLVVRELFDRTRMLPSDQVSSYTLVDITNRLGTSPCAIWAKAIIWFTFDSRFRTSDLARATVDTIKFSADGTARVLPPPHPDVFTTMAGKLRRLTTAYLEHWMLVAGISTGPLFPRVSPAGRITLVSVSPELLRLMLERTLRAAGIDNRGVNFRSIRKGSIEEAKEEARNFPWDSGLSLLSQYSPLDKSCPYAEESAGDLDGPLPEAAPHSQWDSGNG